MLSLMGVKRVNTAQPTFGYPIGVTERRALSASLVFQPQATPLPTREELASAAKTMLSTLASEHRIRDEYVCGWIGERFNARVECHDSDALEFLSIDGAPTILDDFEREYAHRPNLLKEDDDFGRSPMLGVDHETFIFLTTNSLDSAPPIRAGSDGRALGAYRLGLPFGILQDLLEWRKAYCALDHIWIASGPLEGPAYEQLSSPSSALTDQGRACCVEIENATGLATYYFLYRYYSVSETGLASRCPSCGAGWAHTNPGAGPLSNHIVFDYRCDPCRLIARTAVADPEQHASLQAGGRTGTKDDPFE